MQRSSTRLTDHFWLWEFLQSSLIPSLSEYRPTRQEMANVSRVALLLEHIRTRARMPVRIIGGGRPDGVTTPGGKSFYEALTEVGHPASRTSQHRFFCAADFDFFGKGDLTAAFESIQKFRGSDRPNQVILYLEKDGKTPRFIHVGVHDFLNPIKGKDYPVLTHTEGVGYEAMVVDS